MRSRVVLILLALSLFSLAPRAASLQSFIYVSGGLYGSNQNELLVFDAQTTALVTRLRGLGGFQCAIAIAPDGSRLFVNGGVVDLRTHTVIAPLSMPCSPSRAASRSDGAVVYGTSLGQFQSSLWRVDVAANSSRTVHSLNGAPDVVAHPTLMRYYVAGNTTITETPSGSGVLEFDAQSDALLSATATPTAGSQNGSIAISTDGTKLYVGHQSPADIGIFNASTRQWMGVFAETDPYRLFAGGSGNYLYSVSYTDNRLRLFDAVNQTRLGVLQVSIDHPVDVAATSDDARIAVSTAVPIHVDDPGTTVVTVTYANSVLFLDASGRQLNSVRLNDASRTFVGSAKVFTGDNRPSTSVAVTPPGASSCSYRLDTHQSSWGVAGGTGSVTLTSPCSWVASTDASWIHLQQTSGATGTTINFTVDPAATGAGRSGTITIAGQFVTVSQAGYAQNPPYGVFDTPADGAMGLTGSIAVTGWALDDVAVTEVQIWRDPHPNDPAGAVYRGSGPQFGKVFVGRGTFIDGARPDVAAAFPAAPQNTRAGWGYLMLTRGLIWDAQGPFKLYAYAVDYEGNVASLGAKAISVDNRFATKPFGAIDTPAPGGTVSGVYGVTGWVLTPNSGATIPASGVRVSIDGVFLPDVPAMSARSDITAGFPQYDTTTAGRGVAIDTTKYADGLHTIGWFVTDSNGNSDGIGGRFFTVANGSSLVSLWDRLASAASAPEASRTSFRTSR